MRTGDKKVNYKRLDLVTMHSSAIVIVNEKVFNLDLNPTTMKISPNIMTL